MRTLYYAELKTKDAIRVNLLSPTPSLAKTRKCCTTVALMIALYEVLEKNS